MYYAILAYHADDAFETWSEAEDTALMADLHRIGDRLAKERHLGPAARLSPVGDARTLRGKGGKGGPRDSGVVIDGPFAETKEQLLGFYVVDYPTIEGAIEAARELNRANPTAIYEIRPIMLYRPGAQIAGGE